MGLKDYIRIFRQLRGKTGCLVITKLPPAGARVVRYGDFTNADIDEYTKGFSCAG